MNKQIFIQRKKNYLYDTFKVYWIIFLSFSLLLIGCIAVCIGSVNIPILELIGIILDLIGVLVCKNVYQI